MIRASKVKINPYGSRILRSKNKYSSRKFKRTGYQRTIHTQYLNRNLDERGKAIKRGIDSALFVIDVEREAELNSPDAEARIVMCFVYEELKKLGE